MRLLVIDDQQDLLDLVSRVVQHRLQCLVETATSGEAALQRLQYDPPDIIITDLMMPGLHGLELVRKLHARCPETDLLVMTGYAQSFPFVEVIQAGATDFIPKPFPVEAIEAKLVRIFRERSTRKRQLLAEKKWRSLFEFTADGMVILREADLAMEDANLSFCELAQRSEEELAGRPFSELLAPEQVERFMQWLALCRQVGRGAISDLPVQRRSGEIVATDVTATMVQADDQELIFLALKDVTEKRQIEHRLAEVAQKDELTKLLNKRSFQNQVEWRIRHAQESGDRLVLMLLDLDNFKQCNDTHGHLVGDSLLRQLGQIILQSTRHGGMDNGFRIGGDEFAVLLNDMAPNDAVQVADRIRSSFAKLDTYGASLSIGITAYDTDYSTEEWVAKTDAALYSAKNGGKDSVVIA